MSDQQVSFKESTILGQQKYLQVPMKRHGVLRWLVGRGHSTRRDSGRGVRGLQELSSTDKSRVSLAGPAQLLPSRAPSPSRAPLSLSHAPSRMGGSSAATKPGILHPRRSSQRLPEAMRGCAFPSNKGALSGLMGGVITRAGVASPQARSGSLKALGGHSFLC